jgi:type I restriction enzyme S subunit
VLLERVEAEKERLIRQKAIKKKELLPPIEADEIPCVLAKGWEWVRLGNIARFIDYRGNTPPKTESGVKLITAKNVRMGFINDEPKEYISEVTYTKWMTRGFPRVGDLLFTTEAPLGNIGQLLTEEKIALAQRVIDFQTFSNLFPEYLKISLMSPMLQNLILLKATGMTAKGIKAAKLKFILVPIPPIEEQHRIVAKVDQLMSLCDELEARQQKKRESRAHINSAALDRLLAAPPPGEFAEAWRRISDNFDLLYDAPENVGALRQAILEFVRISLIFPFIPKNNIFYQIIYIYPG